MHDNDVKKSTVSASLDKYLQFVLLNWLERHMRQAWLYHDRYFSGFCKAKVQVN